MIYGTFLHTNCCTVSISMQKFSPTSKTLSGKKTPYYLCAAVQLHIHEFYKLMHNTAREREKRGVNWSVRGEKTSSNNRDSLQRLAESETATLSFE